MGKSRPKPHKVFVFVSIRLCVYVCNVNVGVRIKVTQRPARRLEFLFDVMRSARTICV